MVADGSHHEKRVRIEMHKNDSGYILITVLLLLLVLTLVGISAINSSTVENMLSGNIRLRERNVSKADAGIDISTAVIKHTVREMNLEGFTEIIDDANLPQELRSVAFDPDGTTDVSFAFNNELEQSVDVDIDMMYRKWMGGSSVEFASGYEGIGKGGSSGFYLYYRINSVGSGLTSSRTQLGAIYRYVPVIN